MIELVAVVVISAILAGVAAATVSSLTTDRKIVAARQVARDLNFARERAMATGTRCWVTFNAGTEVYSVLSEDASNPGRSHASILTDPASGNPYTITLGTNEFVGVGITTATFDAGSEVGFDWMGQPYNASETALAAQGTVTLTGNYAAAVRVRTGSIVYVPP